MADLQLIQREHVLQSMAEYDDVGQDQFRDTYGLETSKEYLLLQDGREYDSKAIVGAAHQLATGHPLTAEEAADGDAEAAHVLQVLGFDLEGPDLPPLAYTNATTVGQEHARATWALAARERLIEAARCYHSVVSYKELSEFVQRRSLIKTTQLPHHWVGNVLGRVAATCAQEGTPLLSSLCVDAKGQVGPHYAAAVLEHRGETVEDADDHAARERLECHRFFGATLPDDGGEAALTAQLAKRRSRPPARAKAVPKAEVVERPLNLCPVHFQVIPASGVCDLCA